MESRTPARSTSSTSLASSTKIAPPVTDSLKDELPIPLVLTEYLGCYPKHRKDVHAAGSLSMTATSATDATWGWVSNIVSKLNPTSISYGDLKYKFVEFRGGFSFTVREGLQVCMKDWESKSVEEYKAKLIDLAINKIREVVETLDTIKTDPLNLESTIVRRWIDCILFFEELAFLSQLKEIRNTQSHLTQTLYGCIDYILSILKNPTNLHSIEFGRIIQEYEKEIINLEVKKEENNSKSSALSATNKTDMDLDIKRYSRTVAILTKQPKWLLKVDSQYAHLYKFDQKKMTDAGITPIMRNGKQLVFIDTLKDAHQEGYFNYNYARQGFAKYNGQRSPNEFIYDKSIEYFAAKTLEAQNKKKTVDAALVEQEKLRELHKQQEIEERRKQEQDLLKQAEQARLKYEALEAEVEAKKNGSSSSLMTTSLLAAQEQLLLEQERLKALEAQAKGATVNLGDSGNSNGTSPSTSHREESSTDEDIEAGLKLEKDKTNPPTKNSPEFSEFQKYDVGTLGKVGRFPPPPASSPAKIVPERPTNTSSKQHR